MNGPLETACAQLAVWAQSPHTERYNIAVNVSVRQFRHLLFSWNRSWRPSRMPGSARAGLSPESTESLFAQDTQLTITRMGALKDAGVTLSIDDFGIGFALSYLKYLPLDQLDRPHFREGRTYLHLERRSHRAHHHRAFTEPGAGRDGRGARTQAQRDFLAEVADRFQGHLFCKPLPVDELDSNT